jgi:hypothetical protein
MQRTSRSNEQTSPRGLSSSGNSRAGFSSDDEQDETEVDGEDEGL